MPAYQKFTKWFWFGVVLHWNQICFAFRSILFCTQNKINLFCIENKFILYWKYICFALKFILFCIEIHFDFGLKSALFCIENNFILNCTYGVVSIPIHCIRKLLNLKLKQINLIKPQNKKRPVWLKFISFQSTGNTLTCLSAKRC
jgi:hypothetical protein